MPLPYWPWSPGRLRRAWHTEGTEQPLREAGLGSGKDVNSAACWPCEPSPIVSSGRWRKGQYPPRRLGGVAKAMPVLRTLLVAQPEPLSAPVP